MMSNATTTSMTTAAPMLHTSLGWLRRKRRTHSAMAFRKLVGSIQTTFRVCSRPLHAGIVRTRDCSRRSATSQRDTPHSRRPTTSLRPACAAAAREPALLPKAGAENFIAGPKDNKKYAAGDKLEIAKARLAFTV